MIKNNKGAVNLFAYVFYIMITIAVLSIVVISAVDIIDKYEEKYSYNQMIDNITKLDETINLTATKRFSNNNITIYNPEELIINCTRNKITGSIDYSKEIRTDQNTVINDITIYKKLNRLYFERDINKDNIINLTCNDIILNKGKTQLGVSYFEYNGSSEKVDVDIVLRRNRTNSWYNSSWNYRKLIIVNHNKVEDNLTSFPVLISITDTSLINKIKTDYSDIVFTSLDGTTKLYREVEDFNYNTGELVAWVNIPSLDANSDTYIYMYYGNGSASETNDTETWDDDFVMVQHLNNTPANDVLGFIDSTSYDNDGTAKNFNDTVKSTTDIGGKISGAVRFDGDDENDDYIDVASVNDNLLGASGTISAWAYPVTNGSNRFIFSSLGSETNRFYVGYEGNEFYVGRGNPQTSIFSGSSIDYNTWHYTVLVWDETHLFRYFDGNYIGTAEYTNTGTYGGSSKIGAYGSGYTFPGIIDEMKISNIVRSSDWILTEYNNQNSPSTFYTVGDQENR